MKMPSPLALEEAVAYVRQHAGIMALESWGLISIEGPDAASYLQTQTTNDVLQLAPGQGQASALLDRKAHVHAYFSLHRLKNTYWLLTEKSFTPKILERLEQFHFSEKLTMANQCASWKLLTLQGPLSPTILEQTISHSLDALEENDILLLDNLLGGQAFIIRKTLTGEIGYIFGVPSENFNTVYTSLLKASPSPTVMDEAILDTLRIEAGIPKYGKDFDETVLLPATGLQQTCVSYTKGCYVGQEVVAKVKTYGSTQKGLVGLLFQTPAPDEIPSQTPIILEEKEVGNITSFTHSPTLNASIALAYLNREHRIPGKTLTFTLNNKTFSAEVTLLPFYSLSQNTDKAQVLYQNALKLFAEDQEEKAIALLREAISLDPHLKDAYESLGVILARHQQYEEAVSLMQKLSEIAPDDVMPHTNLSVFYMQMGLKETAEEEKALATTLEFKKAMAQKQQQKAEEESNQKQQQAFLEKVVMFQEVLDLDPDDTLANYGLGNTYVALNQFDKAIPLLEKALHLDPKYTVAYLALAKALEGSNQTHEAQLTYQKGIEVASQRGDLMPLQEMQNRLSALKHV